MYLSIIGGAIGGYLTYVALEFSQRGLDMAAAITFLAGFVIAVVSLYDITADSF